MFPIETGLAQNTQIWYNFNQIYCLLSYANILFSTLASWLSQNFIIMLFPKLSGLALTFQNQ